MVVFPTYGTIDNTFLLTAYMSAVHELQTIMHVSRNIRQDSPDESSAVMQLLNQWAGRHALQAQRSAWKHVGVNKLEDYGYSCGFVRWVLQAEQRKELTTSFNNLSKHGSFSPANDTLLQLLIEKMVGEIRFPLSEDSKNATLNLFGCIREWESHNQNVAPAVLKSIESARQCIAQQDLAWSEKLCAYLPKRLRTHLYRDASNVVEQQKIIKDLKKGFFKHNFTLFGSTHSVQNFLIKIEKYSLAEQQQKDGVLFCAIVELLNQCNAECLKIATDGLLSMGWKSSQLAKHIAPHAIQKKCHELDHQYIDTINTLFNAQQQKRLFTWVVEGLANNLYKDTPQQILTNVQEVLNKPYAKPSIFEIQFEDLRPYTDHIMRLWECDPKMNKKHRHDRYACSGLNLTSCEDFLAVNAAHFSSPAMKKAVDLLNTIKHPSLQGILEFWGRLHDIDFGVGTPQTFTLPHYFCASDENGDVHLRDKAILVEQRIAIGGQLPSIKAVARKSKI